FFMTMPATPMNEAAERYSPEMAEAFQPTETARPATKKSEAVFDLRADQKPIQIVAATVRNEKQRIHGSVRFRTAGKPEPASASIVIELIAGLALIRLLSSPAQSSAG